MHNPAHSGELLRERIPEGMIVTEVILGAMDEQLRTPRECVCLGQAAPYEVMTLQTEVERTCAEIPVLRKQLQQNKHRLAVLVGETLGVGSLPTFALGDFTLQYELSGG